MFKINLFSAISHIDFKFITGRLKKIDRKLNIFENQSWL